MHGDIHNAIYIHQTKILLSIDRGYTSPLSEVVPYEVREAGGFSSWLSSMVGSLSARVRFSKCQNIKMYQCCQDAYYATEQKVYPDFFNFFDGILDDHEEKSPASQSLTSYGTTPRQWTILVD